MFCIAIVHACLSHVWYALIPVKLMFRPGIDMVSCSSHQGVAEQLYFNDPILAYHYLNAGLACVNDCLHTMMSWIPVMSPVACIHYAVHY